MHFTDEQLNSFVDLYKREFGVGIDHNEAYRQATSLVSLVERIYRPMTKEEWDTTMRKMRDNE
jgi:hypothetical protein